MANFFQKLFGSKPATPSVADTTPPVDYRKIKEERLAKLNTLITETLALYKTVSCPCAFPRFRQIVGIDCTDYRASFYSTETELFIEAARPFYETKVLGHPNNNDEEWTCKTCGSVWLFNWQDFSISVSRNVLKIKELHAVDAGAPTRLPIPLYVGLTGHSYPDRTKIAPVDFDEFKTYMQERI